MRIKIAVLIVSIATALASQSSFSQDRAPSCWLKYQDYFQGDILINTIRVKSPSPTYTYYCTLQWNAGAEGGGYCGIQEHPDGRNFIFSIWDPHSSTEAITASYTHTDTKIENFGGEGTGLKSWNFDIGWETDQWYSIVSRAWDENSHTMFGYWVFNQTDSVWYHLVTMDFPVPDVKFNSSTGSFIEDWLGNGWEVREVHHKEGWKRKTSDLSWFPFTNSYFDRVSPDAGANNYLQSYDGGSNDEYYFMKSGGTTSPITNRSGSSLSLANNNSDPGYEPGSITNFNLNLDYNDLGFTWDIDSSKSPQFSYHIKIFNNPEFTGNALLEISSNTPHARTHNIDISSLDDNAQYYTQIYISDIFDNKSDTLTDSFILGTPAAIESNRLENILIHPNPFEEEINIKFKDEAEFAEFELINTLGAVVFRNKYEDIFNIKIPLDISSGIYFLKIKTDQKEGVFKLIKN